MATLVINIKDKDDYPPDKLVFIMRPGRWGNKYIIGRDGTRDEVCDKFEVDFLTKVEEDVEFRAAVLRELKDKVLVCCCKPERCHGDTYAEFCDSEVAQESPVVPPIQDLEGPMFSPLIQMKYHGQKEAS